MSVSDRIQRIASVAQSHVDQNAYSGIEWNVHRNGEPWLRGQAGYADALNGVSMPEKPIYRIYSMTKPIVSAVALMLMEQGKLRLMDPVSAFLPEFGEMGIVDESGGTRPARKPMIIEHLLTHRAGLSYGFLADCPVGLLYRETAINDAKLTLTEMIDILADLPLAFEPGTEWRYSVATDVLARILEIIVERELPQILDDCILGPLALADTGFMVAEKDRDRIMAMFGDSDLDRLLEFDDQPQTLIPADVSASYPTDDPKFARGGLGLYSTADDYLVVAKFLNSGMSPSGERLLARKTLDMMWTNRVPAPQRPLKIGPLALPGYGYSLAGRVLVEPGQALGLSSYGECGWAGAASTYFWMDRSEDLIGVIMAQYLGAKLPLGDDMRAAVYQALDD